MNIVKLLAFSQLVLFMVGVVGAQEVSVERYWEQNCAKCHGPDGAGRTIMGQKLGVKDFSSQQVQRQFTDDEAVKAIRYGVKNGEFTKMKSFSTLDLGEAKALVSHVRRMAGLTGASESRNGAGGTGGQQNRGSNFGFVNVKADDDTYDVYVDARFVGNSPAKVKLAEGSHVIEVKKTGFRDFRKEVDVSGGAELSLRAVLEKQ